MERCHTADICRALHSPEHTTKTAWLLPVPASVLASGDAFMSKAVMIPNFMHLVVEGY